MSMAEPYYCNEADIEEDLNIVISATTDPTSTELIEIITRMENEIDAYTNHAWHSSRAIAFTDYMVPPRLIRYDTTLGWWVVDLPWSELVTLTKIEVHSTAGTFTDWVASGSYSAGWDNDYVIDKPNGRLWLKSPSFANTGQPLRLTGSYGYDSTTVPGAVHTACTLLTKAAFVQHADLTTLVEEEGGNMSFTEKQAAWREEAYNLLRPLRKVIGVTR